VEIEENRGVIDKNSFDDQFTAFFNLVLEFSLYYFYSLYSLILWHTESTLGEFYHFGKDGKGR